jgi:hypothetical protein
MRIKFHYTYFEDLSYRGEEELELKKEFRHIHVVFDELDRSKPAHHYAQKILAGFNKTCRDGERTRKLISAEWVDGFESDTPRYWVDPVTTNTNITYRVNTTSQSVARDEASVERLLDQLWVENPYVNEPDLGISDYVELFIEQVNSQHKYYIWSYNISHSIMECHKRNISPSEAVSILASIYQLPISVYTNFA